MKINIIPTVITLAAAALLAYLFYTLSSAEEQMLKALVVSGFVSVAICLECGIGISPKDAHHKMNTSAVSILFLLLFVIEHCCFAIWGTSMAWLIITTGLMLVIYLLIYYGISKTKM